MNDVRVNDDRQCQALAMTTGERCQADRWLDEPTCLAHRRKPWIRYVPGSPTARRARENHNAREVVRGIYRLHKLLAQWRLTIDAGGLDHQGHLPAIAERLEFTIGLLGELRDHATSLAANARKADPEVTR